MNKQPVTKKLNVPVDTVWDAISKIGRLDVWFPIIESCRIEGEGPGAVRRMTLVDDGGEMEDTIEEIDAAKRRLVYLRPVLPFPAPYYRGTVEVFESYDGLAVVAWTIDFESKPEDAQSITDLIKSAISDGIDGMERDLLANASSPQQQNAS